MLQQLNYIDLILLVIVSMAVLHGRRRGFIDSSIDIAIWLGSFLLALYLSEKVIRLFKSYDISGIWVRPIFFILLLVGFSRLIFVLCDKLSAAVPEKAQEHPLNRAAGILLGLFTGTIYTALLSFFFLTYDTGAFSRKAEESQVVTALTRQNTWPGKPLSDIFSDIGFKLGSNFTIYPKPAESIRLPFKTANFEIRHDLELKMLGLLNQEREKEGLKALEFDEEMAEVARKHAADMLKRGYFSHFSPEGKSPFDRIRDEKLRFLIAGENLALARSLELAHEGLMESPGHRANILHKSFGRVGIGVLDAGVHGIIVTQEFRN